MFESQISAAKVQQNFTTVDAFVTKKKVKDEHHSTFFPPVRLKNVIKRG